MEAPREDRTVGRASRGLFRRYASLGQGAGTGISRPRLQYRLESTTRMGIGGGDRWKPDNPIHQMIMKWMGVSIVENLDLEHAVDTARRLKRYEFMITFAPLPVEGGTGSPVNPLAIF